MSERESLCDHAPRVYRIRVCGICREQLDWLPDDGEGMSPRAYCRGREQHLVIDGRPWSEDGSLTILVQEVVEAA